MAENNVNGISVTGHGCLSMLQARMPELQELQRQLALTAEELADLQYSAVQQQTAAQADLQAAQEECTQLTGQLSAMRVERNTLLTALEAVKREAAATAVQLADATELYAGLQGGCASCSFIITLYVCSAL